MSIQYKNDLPDIARYYAHTNFKSNLEKTLKIAITKDKFDDIISEYKKSFDFFGKTDMTFDETTKKWENYSTFQLRGGPTNLIITWLEIDTTDAEKTTTFITAIQFNYSNDKESNTLVDNLIKKIELNLHKEDDSKMFFVVGLNDNQFTLLPEKIEDKKSNIELNYGKEFVKINDNIIKLISETNSGIIVLDGAPGTGKTAYIKHVINQVCDYKDIIYIPRFLLTAMANPDFISFLREQRESLIILEDADEILLNREDGLNTVITTNILSITNGLLNDQLKIQIIATFNAERKYIDKKLLKQGKIVEDWTFKLLTAEQANLLAKSLGIEILYNNPISLSEVYEDYESADKKNKKTKLRKPNKKRVGFKDDSE